MATATPTEEWEIGTNPWDLPCPTVPLNDGLEPVARQVLEGVLVPLKEPGDIEIDTLIQGGTLRGLDIYHMNAISAMKLSVFEDFVRDNGHYEIYADNDGVIRKFDIGLTTANVTERYRVPTRNITNEVSQVKVVGFDSPPCLYMGDTYSIIPDEADDFESEQIPPIHLIVQDTCYELVFDRYSYYCYRAPNYASKFNDSIESLFEEGYDETVIAWAHNLEGTDALSDLGSINFSEYTFYPVEIAGFVSGPFAGPSSHSDITLFPIEVEAVSDEEARCWIGPEETRISYSLDLSPYKYEDPDYGGQLISDVEELAYFIITGHKITYALFWWPRTSTGRPFHSTEADVYVERKDTVEAIALQDGVDYTSWFDGDNVLNISAGFYQRQSWEGYGYRYYFTDWEWPTGYTGEFGFLWPRLGATGIDTGGIGTAMWVTGMYLVLRRKLNSVTIFDPDGNADGIMNDLIYEVTPIVQKDARPPTCGAGIFQGCVDWDSTVFDDDPLTIQDLHKTSDLALLNDAMVGVSTVSIDAPYLVTAEEVQTAANKIYGLFNDEETIDEVNYVCSPDSTPRLGENYGEGVINSISYSYNDQSAYTISITSGPQHMREFAGTGTNIWMMETETIKRRGTVTQSSGDGLYYVVSVEGLGEFIAVNTVVGDSSPEIGDVVDVEINNIPMGWA
jgi:hypothetical protein